MRLDKKFAFLASQKDLDNIDKLAEDLERSKSDAVRVVLRKAATRNPNQTEHEAQEVSH